MKKIPSVLSAPAPGAKCMYMAIIFQHLLSNRMANQSKISRGALWERGKKVFYKWP